MKGLLTKREAIAAAEDGIFPPYIDELLEQISDKLIEATDRDRVAQEFFAGMVQATRIGTKQALESWRQWVAHTRDAGPEHVADLRRIYEAMRIDQQLFIGASSPDIAIRKRACAQLENGGVVHLDDKPDADVAAYLPPRGILKIFTDRPQPVSLAVERPPAKVHGFFSVLDDQGEVGRTLAEQYGWHPSQNLEPASNDAGDMLHWNTAERMEKARAWQAADEGKLAIAGIMAFAQDTDSAGRLSRGRAMMQLMLEELYARGKRVMLAEVNNFRSIGGYEAIVPNKPSMGMINGIQVNVCSRVERYNRLGIDTVNHWGVLVFDIERALMSVPGPTTVATSTPALVTA